jgi:hypothetical protein
MCSGPKARKRKALARVGRRYRTEGEEAHMIRVSRVSEARWMAHVHNFPHFRMH